MTEKIIGKAGYMKERWRELKGWSEKFFPSNNLFGQTQLFLFSEKVYQFFVCVKKKRLEKLNSRKYKNDTKNFLWDFEIDFRKILFFSVLISFFLVLEGLGNFLYLKKFLIFKEFDIALSKQIFPLIINCVVTV